MDPRFLVSREEIQNVQMDLKQVQFVQSSHADRLLRLEKRQADDAALRSVWNSPFPSVLGGTPQHGPVRVSSNEMFDDLDDQGQNLLSSLHLEAEDEPTRRGAASRANSVRFDESALQGSNWGGQSGRQSGEFGPARPSSGLGGHALMERSLSHKSDGRHSSAGQSVHSAHSGRASSLGLDTNFVIGGHDEDSPVDVSEPPPGLFILGSVPSIIRCWLKENFSSSTLLYAAVCTGAQRSTIDFSLVKELDMVNNIQRDLDGIHRIRLPVYLAEARVTQSNSRSPSPAPQLPSIHATFEVNGMAQPETAGAKLSIRIFIGSDTLRIHSADLLFSQNLMTLYGTARDKLSVPFVRPEDDSIFKNLVTVNATTAKPKLNAIAPEFVSRDKSMTHETAASEIAAQQSTGADTDSQSLLSPTAVSQSEKNGVLISTASESGAESEKHAAELTAPTEPAGKESAGHSETARRESSTAILGPWRQATSGIGSDNGQAANGPLSGYQPAGRGLRNMKVLKASKSSGSSSARTGAAYEPAPPPRTSGEMRRKSQAGVSDNGVSSGTPTGNRWDTKRSFSGTLAGGDGAVPAGKATPTADRLESGKSPSAPRSANNPLGNASAFASWMGGRKPGEPAAAGE